jgi:hypothetical protein
MASYTNPLDLTNGGSRAAERIYNVDPNLFQVPNAQGNRQLINTMMRDANVGQREFGIDPMLQNQFRARQAGLADMLMSRARGSDSVAGAQLRAAGDAAARGAMSAARSVGSNNAGRSLRQALQFSNAARLQANEQAAQTALAEQAQAQGALSSVLAQGRGQDIGLGQANAQLGIQSFLGQRQLQNQQQQALLGAQLGMDATQLNANMQRGALNQQAGLAQQGMEHGNDVWLRNAIASALGGAVNGATGAASMAMMGG